MINDRDWAEGHIDGDRVIPRHGTKIINVKCTLIVPTEVPDDPDYPVQFTIEDNSCPGTGMVWSALSKIMEEHDKNSTCWACALQGKNEII